MKYFFKLVRAVLTPLVLSVDWLTTPRGVRRSDAEQQRVDAETGTMSLYCFRACPFCIKVRRAMKRLSLDIETRDAQKDPAARQELLNGGGEIKVPCLKIAHEDGRSTWMYESADIVQYLNHRFAAGSSN